MKTKPFYRYRNGKNLIDTPNLPPKGTAYETLTQAIADTGKALTDGTKSMGVVITADISRWAEVDAPPKPIWPGQASFELTLVKAELDRYKAAVAEVTAMEPIIEQTIEQMEEIVL